MPLQALLMVEHTLNAGKSDTRIRFHAVSLSSQSRRATRAVVHVVLSGSQRQPLRHT